MKNKVNEILNENGIIVLDTNVYLNIYDRSPEFSTFSVSVLESIKNKIILPCTVKREFLRNYRECNNRQKMKVEKACDKLRSQLNSIKQKLQNQCAVIKSFQFPDIDDIEFSLIEKIDESIEIVNEYGQEHDILQVINTVNMQENGVYKLVCWLIDNGHCLSEISIDDIYIWALEASKRYVSNTPPGFKDKEKADGLDKYGDYFIWKQTIEYAKKYNKSVIFVTDDMKIDWFEQDGNEFKFHHLLEDEFAKEVGTSFIGLNSIDFLNIIAEINEIEKTTAVECALKFTADDYIHKIDNNQIIYDNLENLLYSSEQYVDMDSLSASATEGLEISDEIEESTLIGYEIGQCTDFFVTYFLTYHIKTEATSYEYWGRDDDTKEVIQSPGRIHKLEGEVVLQVTRNIGEYCFDVTDCSYENASIISGNLKEISAYDVDSLCYQCGKSLGSYQDYYGNPICGNCMVNDNNGEICTICGTKVPNELMYDDHKCLRCAREFDD